MMPPPQPSPIFTSAITTSSHMHPSAWKHIFKQLTSSTCLVIYFYCLACWLLVKAWAEPTISCKWEINLTIQLRCMFLTAQTRALNDVTLQDCTRRLWNIFFAVGCLYSERKGRHVSHLYLCQCFKLTVQILAQIVHKRCLCAHKYTHVHRYT